MPHHPVPTNAPYDLASEHVNWLFDPAGNPCPIIARSRRRVVLNAYGQRIVLRRRDLEATGVATGHDGRIYRVSTYIGEHPA